ncbi:hypothetical protein PTKIN_Ptkin06aG0130300 [Pterospermum kingtungense]
MRKAIQMTNNHKVDGKIIRVKKATFGWNERKQFNKVNGEHAIVKTSNEARKLKGKDHRSYKEVVMGKYGSDKLVVRPTINHTDPLENGIVILDKGDCSSHQKDQKEDEIAEPNSKLVYNHMLEDFEYEWLSSCAIARVKPFLDIESIAAGLKRKGFCCRICQMGGANVLLRFETTDKLKDFLKNSSVAYDEWFEEIKPWSKSCLQRQISLWIVLKEVPLHLWDISFFKAIGEI